MLEELENIDDECDALGITFVKIDNIDEAKEYGIEDMPAMLYFEKGIPTVYEGRLQDEESVLKWLEQQSTSDEIEDITDEMLDLILEKMTHVAVLFCKLLSNPHQTNQFTYRSIFPSHIFSILCSTVELCDVGLPFSQTRISDLPFKKPFIVKSIDYVNFDYIPLFCVL